jgi:response regulator RpfG family c-di-GMP phosphodiesterase
MKERPMSDAMAGSTAVSKHTLLCVDDEANILQSLRRLLHGSGYRVLIAHSGAAAIAVLEQEAVDIVISDMRMPEMDGAQFLEAVRSRWPGVTRMLLTGHADIGAVIGAINRGEIYRYITKPWDDHDMLLVIRLAFERRALEHDKRRLEALTQEQNEQLRLLNQGLEATVQERTAALQQSNIALSGANGKLKTNFITTIKILASMIEMRGAHMAGHARRVADLARRIGVKLGLDARELQEIFIAGLLHEIGKIGFTDQLLALQVNQLAGGQLGQFRRHPARAAELLMPLDDLRGVAAILRAHMERFDGEGFPDGLSGAAIPLGARILALASDYDNLQIGALVARRVAPDDAKHIIYDSAGKRYDPEVVAAFRVLLDGEPPEPIKDVAVLAGELVPGMVLSRDLVSREGLMLLSAEHVLDARMIQQVQDFEAKSEGRLVIRIWPPEEVQ